MNSIAFSIDALNKVEQMHHALQQIIQEMPNEMYEGVLSHFLNNLECQMAGVYGLQQDLYSHIEMLAVETTKCVF